MENWVDIADADSLAVGTCRTVEVGGRQFALARVADGFHLVDNACPHRGTSLGAGTIDANFVYCPLHGWAFNLVSGACPDRPEKSVRTYPVELRDGKVWVQLGAIAPKHT